MGFLQKLGIGLKKSSDKITGGISDIFSKKKLDATTLEALEELLLSADMGVSATTEIMQKFAAQKQNKDISADEIRTALAQQIEAVLAPCEQPLVIDSTHKPYVILMVGVNGVGKTTTIGKLANKYNEDGKKVMLIAADTFRAGAVEQIKVWANRTNSLFYGKENTDPAGVIYDGLELAKKEAADIVLIDTAGRLQNKVNLMKELEKMNKVIAKIIPNAPHETLLVIDATTGQNGIMQAKSFKEITNITGIVLTKLDGTAKGGIVLAIKEDVKIPVKFIGLGEGINDLKPFDIESYIYGLFKDMM